MAILDNFTGTGPNQITFPIVMDPKGTWGVGGANFVVVDNGSAAVILISDLSGRPYITVPAYQARSWSLGAFDGVMFQKTNAATIQPNDTLTIFVYDNAQNFQSTSYGPAAWGAGALPATLVDVNPGDGFFAWQVEQIIKYLQDGGVSGNLLINGSIGSTGPAAGLTLYDQDGIGGDYFALETMSSTFNIISSVFGVTAQVSEAGAWSFANVIHASNLLAQHIVNAPTGASASGTGGTGLVSLSLAADVPSAAVAVAFAVAFSSTGAQGWSIANANPNTNALYSGSSAGGGGVLGLPTPQTIWYTISGAGNWTLQVNPTFYWLPS